ncbi:MAG: hypothetical protein J6K96_02955 [Treponema sp.]|nr:hypothetical protein [Treponema sp.]
MSDFLFAKPGVIDGIMSIVDLFGIAPNYNDSLDGISADERAFAADIDSLSRDMDKAYEAVTKDYA